MFNKYHCPLFILVMQDRQDQNLSSSAKQTSKFPFVGFVTERQGQRFLKLKCSGKQKGNLEQAEIILELQVLTNQEGGGRQIRNLILTNIRGAPPPWPP